MCGGYVYTLANRKRGALYTGVTADIAARMVQHRDGDGSKFCREYGIDTLVYIETADRVEDATAREKAIKKWRRAWKIELIEKTNPDRRICSSTSTASVIPAKAGTHLPSLPPAPRSRDGSPLSRG